MELFEVIFGSVVLDVHTHTPSHCLEAFISLCSEVYCSGPRGGEAEQFLIEK